MEFTNKEEYRTIHWSGNIDEDRMLIKVYLGNSEFEGLYYHRYFVNNFILV